MCLLAAVLAERACGQTAGSKTPPPTANAGPAAGPAPIENLKTLPGQVYSGAEPHGDAALSKLAEMGVKTIVSVDGIRPNIAGAKTHGMRYVHIPIGYDGVDAQAQALLTRVVREAQAPIYIHCHHGKHRGPAAAAILCLAAGTMTHDEALAFMKEVGTDPQYTGLFRDVRQFKPLATDAVLPPLVEAAEVDSLAAAMSQLDRAWDGVKLSQAAGWKTPADHPDIVPEREALLVWEGLREGRRTLSAEHAGLEADLDAAAGIAEELRDALVAGGAENANEIHRRLDAACKACHAEHRN